MTTDEKRVTITVTDDRKPAPRLGTDRTVAALQSLFNAIEVVAPESTDLIVDVFNALQDERDRTEMLRDRDHKRYAEHMATLDEMLSHARQQRDDALAKFVTAERQGRETERHLVRQYMAINLGLSSEDIERMLNVLTGNCEVYIPQPRMDEITEIFEDVARYVLEEEIYMAEDEADYEDELRRDAEQGGYIQVTEVEHD